MIKSRGRGKPKQKIRGDEADDFALTLSRAFSKVEKESTDSVIEVVDKYVEAIIFSYRSLRKALRKGLLPKGFTRPKGEPKRYLNIKDDNLLDVKARRAKRGSYRPLKRGEYIEIDNRHSIWRDRDSTYHDSIIDDSIGRDKLETEIFSAKEADLLEIEGMERAHTLGAGTGFESPYAIYYAPKTVNGFMQNEGIEALLRGTHLLLKDRGRGRVGVLTKTVPHTGTLRLKEITYHVDIIGEDGKRLPLFNYKINVSKSRPYKIKREITDITHPEEIAPLIKDLSDIEKIFSRQKIVNNEGNRRKFKPNEAFFSLLEKAAREKIL